MHYGGHGRYPLQKSKVRGGDEAEVHWRWKILMIVETVRKASNSYFCLRLRMYAIRSFDSSPSNMKSGIFLWFECRKTFREIPVVDGRSAMLWKLGGSALSEWVIG
jgi:hypothetical protein